MTSMYASQWFLTMFATLLPFNLVYRIMDLFLLEVGVVWGVAKC